MPDTTGRIGLPFPSASLVLQRADVALQALHETHELGDLLILVLLRSLRLRMDEQEACLL